MFLGKVLSEIGHAQKLEYLSSHSYFLVNFLFYMAGLEDDITHFVRLGLSYVKTQLSLRGRRGGIKIQTNLKISHL